MISSLESFSTELLFEVFEYLSPNDLFRSFLSLNNRLNDILYSYPLRLDGQSMSRLEFDYVCSHLQPKQVISLRLSDSTVPNQVEIFKEYFPFFKDQFLRLRSVALFQLYDHPIDLPSSVQFLEIRKYDIYQNFGFDFTPLLERQSKVLTHLKIDRIGLLKYIRTPFPALTHLKIDGGCAPDIDSYISRSDQYKNVDATSIFRPMGSPITHLHLFVDNENPQMKIDLQQFSHCLTDLTLRFPENCLVSYQSFEQYLNHLHQLTRLTLEANGRSDLIDGHQWKSFLSKTKIQKFHFRFVIPDDYFDIDQNRSESLQSFRSSFWLKEKQWYVECRRNDQWQTTSFHTIPRFRSKFFTIYPSFDIPSLTTAPADLEQKLLRENRVEVLKILIDQCTEPPKERFEHVQTLVLNGAQLIPVNLLQSIVDPDEIKELDLDDVKFLSTRELEQLIEHLPRLNCLTMKYHPLFIIPPQIRTLRLEGDIQSIIIDHLSHTIPHVKKLEIQICTKDQMVCLIDQLEHIDDFLFMFDDLYQSNYLETFVEKFHHFWLEKNSHRLATHHFTFRSGDEYQHIQMAIGGPKAKKYSLTLPV